MTTKSMRSVWFNSGDSRSFRLLSMRPAVQFSPVIESHSRFPAFRWLSIQPRSERVNSLYSGESGSALKSPEIIAGSGTSCFSSTKAASCLTWHSRKDRFL